MAEGQTSSKTFLYGTRAVLESILAGQEIDKILVLKKLNNPLIQELLQTAREHHIPVQRVPVQKLQRYTRKNHQGVVCLLSAIGYSSLDHIISECYHQGQAPLLVVLDRITDVRNFGAIARTAICAGAHALVVPSKGHAQITHDAIKTSAGALNYLPVCRVSNLNNSLKDLQNQGLQIVACTEKASHFIYQADLKGPTALLMGSEEDGIDQKLLKTSNLQVKIPMTGPISSLNVSVAAGLILYECVRQRHSHSS